MSGIALVALVPAMNLVRFVGLEESPPGFYVDEAAGAVTIQCLATEGRDANGARYPLFSDVGFGTPKPPPYLYPGLLWTKLFGFSIASFRAFSAAVGTATVCGLALLGRRLLDRRFALLVAVAASLSPWAFLSSRIGWEVPLAPCFVVWGTYFLLQGGRAPCALASGLCLALAMHSYPPALAQVPLAVPLLFWFARKRGGVPRTGLLLAGSSFLLVSIPLAWLALAGRAGERLRSVGIVNPGASLQEAGTFVRNLLLHLDPGFLFVSGDHNLRHSTQFTGQLGWLDSFALALAVALWAVGRLRKSSASPGAPRRMHALPLFFLVNAAIGVVPAALTRDGLPHALRSIGAWPFVSLLTGYALWTGLDRLRVLLPLAAAVSLAFATGFTTHFFAVYPETARTWFDAKLRDLASAARTRKDWQAVLAHFPQRGVQVRYFLMTRVPGQTCSRSERTVSRLLAAGPDSP